MVNWKALWRDSSEGHALLSEAETLLPTHTEHPPRLSPSPRECTKIALRLKYQIERVIPFELDLERITEAHSSVITDAVIATAKAAGGKDGEGAIVFCLLIVKKWFKRQAVLELWDADLHQIRAVTCEVLAKKIIEAEEDTKFLLSEVLLKRYSVLTGDKHGQDVTAPANVIEKAVDMHALRVIGSSGYQKCVSYLWKGWMVQDEDDPSRFVEYAEKGNTTYWVHVDPDRMRVPLYQNALQALFSVIYLGLYTGAINTINPTGDLDIVEALLYLFTLGFMCDEAAKLWKVGRFYISFWNGFNSILYGFLTTSFILRMVALGHDLGSERRGHFNELSYDFLAFSAPMFWARLLLYFDTLKFFGTMLVVLKVMMRESVIFFALLFLVLVGFFQAFLGLDQVDNQITSARFVLKNMVNAIMTSPDFDGFDNYSPPFGLILYYVYCFIVMTVLLNILIALYNASYESITDNSTDEYMALFASKTLQFVRAPDENVFIAPLNLIELFGLVLPFEWWMNKTRYEKLNDYVMATIYSPLLFITAFWEVQNAKRVRLNDKRGREEDDEEEEWEILGQICDLMLDGDADNADGEETQGNGAGGDGNVGSGVDGHGGDKSWGKRVERTIPNIDHDAVKEVRDLRKEVVELRLLLEKVLEGKTGEGDVAKEKDSDGNEGDKKETKKENGKKGGA